MNYYKETDTRVLRVHLCFDYILNVLIVNVIKTILRNEFDSLFKKIVVLKSNNIIDDN